MLVLTTMLTSIADDLPRTGVIKYIDYWMLFSMTIPIMEILLHTIEDHFIRRGVCISYHMWCIPPPGDMLTGLASNC